MSTNYFVEREFCPGCKSSKRRTIYSSIFVQSPIKEYLDSLYSAQGKIEFEYLNGAKFILDECLDCGMVYQEKIPNDFLMKKLYEEWLAQTAFVSYQQKHDLDYYSEIAQEVMILVAYFNTIPSQLKFLDFGMGWGNWPRLAKAFSCDAYGTELSETMVEYAKSQGIKVIGWDEILNYEFDFINTEQVFEHIPEPLETLHHLKKSLKPKGLIKISVPNGNDIKRRLRVLDWTAPKGSRNSLNPVSPLEHINCFTHNSIIRMANIAGLETVKIPLASQYVYSTNWRPIQPMIKNVVRPIYRNIFQRSTRLFFRPKRN